MLSAQLTLLCIVIIVIIGKSRVYAGCVPGPQHVDAKRQEERRNFQVNFGSFRYMFFLLPLSMPYINWASQQGCLFYQKFSLRSSDLPLFYFYGLFPLSFSHHCFGLLFPVLTTQQYQVQNFFDNLSSVFA